MNSREGVDWMSQGPFLNTKGADVETRTEGREHLTWEEKGRRPEILCDEDVSSRSTGTILCGGQRAGFSEELV